MRASVERELGQDLADLEMLEEAEANGFILGTIRPKVKEQREDQQ